MSKMLVDRAVVEQALHVATAAGYPVALIAALKAALAEPVQEPDPWGAGFEAGYAAGVAEYDPQQAQQALEEADRIMGHDHEATEWRERWGHLFGGPPPRPAEPVQEPVYNDLLRLVGNLFDEAYKAGKAAATAQPVQDTDCHAQGICQRSGYSVGQKAEPVQEPVQEPVAYSGSDENPPVFARRWAIARDGFGLQRADDGPYVHIDDALSVLHQWMLVAPPQRPAEPVQEQRELNEVLTERDDAEDYIDAILDEVLGPDRAEWSSAYGRADALEEVRERIAQMLKPSIDKAWNRFEVALAQQAEPQEPGVWARPWPPVQPQQAQPQESFDFLAHLRRQAEFSARTFGPGARVDGVTDHIAKELQEVRDSGGALAEWVDVIILGLDGAWRSGASPEQIVEALVAKQTKNEGRKWPDWRTAPEGKAIEHDRSQERAEAFDTLPDDYEVN